MPGTRSSCQEGPLIIQLVNGERAFSYSQDAQVTQEIRYVYADVVFGNVLKQTLSSGHSRVGLHYDIMCQYSVKMWDRWQRFSSPLRPLKQEDFDYFVTAIGKFHLAAHQDSCYARFSLNNIPGVGRLDGEGAERCWANLNHASHSTSERGPGARVDAISQVMHHWNWCKVTGQCKFATFHRLR